MAIDYTNSQKLLENRLAASPTALGSGTVPTASDISAARSLAAIKSQQTAQRDALLQEQWYADDMAKQAASKEKMTMKTPPKGVIKTALQALGAPLYSIVGATEAALGKGTKKGLYENIKSNIEEQGTFGDLLRQYKVPGWAASTGGFALDILMDPINWVTMGAEAFVPRIAYGITKAGPKGLAAGAKSVGLDIARTATKPMDWFGLAPKAKILETGAAKVAGEVVEGVGKTAAVAGEGVAETMGKIATGEVTSNFRGKIVDASRDAKDAYNKLTGRTMESLLKSSGIASDSLGVIQKYVRPGEKTADWLEKIIEPFLYTPQGWFRKMVGRADEWREAGGTVEDYSTYLATKGLVKGVRRTTAGLKGKVEKELTARLGPEFEQVLSSGERIPVRKVVGPKSEWSKLTEQTLAKAGVKSRKADDLAMAEDEINAMLEDPEIFAKLRSQNRAVDAAEIVSANAPDASIFNHELRRQAFTEEFLDEVTLRVAAKRVKEGSTAVEMDELRKILKAAKESEKSLTGVKWFDNAAKKLSDQWIIKDHLKGEQIIKGYKTFIDIFKATKIGQLSSTMLAYLNNAAMTQMYGIRFYDPGFLRELKIATSAAMASMGAGGAVGSKSFFEWISHPEMQKLAAKYPEIFANTFKINPSVIYKSDTLFYEAMNKYSEAGGIAKMTKAETSAMRRQLLENMRKNGLLLEGADTTYAGKEIFESGSYVNKLTDWLEARSAEGNVAAKAGLFLYKKPIELFETSDQSYKMGLAAHLIKNGLTTEEILAVNRSQINKLKLGEDIFEVKDAAGKATGRYTFSGLKAADIASDVYMNYAAMPGAVKVLRNMPLFGMPFASFAAAMLTKTGQTLAYNASFFNKVQFMLNELNGGRSPLEKLALNSPYYKWLRENGMVSLPFFRDNPVYLNMASFFPYFTMNIFEPTERRTEKNLGGTITKIIDSMPIFKTPEGQVALDYFIIPAILRDSSPTGIFDQPLYPAGASAATKAAYFTRSLAETVTPGILAPLGIITPEPLIPYIPFGYKYRRMGNTARGKTPLGKTTSESKVSAIARGIASYFGLGLYPVSTKYVK